MLRYGEARGPRDLHHGPREGGDYLFVTVTPTKPGVAHLIRVEVQYQRGIAGLFQRGTESIWSDYKVSAK